MASYWWWRNPVKASSVFYLFASWQWRHNEGDGVSNHQPHDCLLNRLFRHWSKKTSKLPVTGLCAGNSPVTGEFPAQRTSNAESVSIWWRHHGMKLCSALLNLCDWKPQDHYNEFISNVEPYFFAVPIKLLSQQTSSRVFDTLWHSCVITYCATSVVNVMSLKQCNRVNAITFECNYICPIRV